MTKRDWLAWVVLSLLACPAWGQDRDTVQGYEAVAGELLVKFQPYTAADTIAAAMAAADIDVAQPVGGIGVLRLHSRTRDVATLVNEFSARPDVVYAEPNFIVHAIAVPNDPSFGQLWGLQNTGQIVGGQTGIPGADISAVSAWDVSTGSPSSVVAVIDTGIDYNHADLAANVWSAPAAFTVHLGGIDYNCAAGTHGFNAVTGSRSCNPLDDFAPVYHGTHVSGTIGAVGNNNLGVVGVNWTASIMGIKFLNSAGSGSNADAVDAIEFAVQAKMAFGSSANLRVLSNSWGGGSFSQALLDEINRANDNGMLFVAAAGNNGSNNDINPFYPASYGASPSNAPSVVAVAATDNRDNKASFSNFGSNSVHLGAPGVNVLSTSLGGGYQYLSGTSMATPHVSGAAALILSQCSLNTADLKTNILQNVDLIASMSGLTITGGRLNVNQAIRACSGTPSFTVTASPSSVNPGDPLTVQWTAPSGRPATDWIGLYKVGDPNTAYTWWAYTNGATSGSFALTAPSDAGQYEFRYLLNDGFTVAATSNPVTVTAGSFTLVASPSSVNPGDPLTVQWTASAGRPATDWIGLYLVGDPNTAYLWWSYTNGATSGSFVLSAPANSGQYEFRYLLNDGFTDAARSGPVTVK
jgi:subtilisin family serine protease